MTSALYLVSLKHDQWVGKEPSKKNIILTMPVIIPFSRESDPFSREINHPREHLIVTGI